MRNSDRRISKLSGQLSARERAVLVLRSWQDGLNEDLSWRWSMPQDQVAEFNRYIDLMNGVNQHLLPLLVVLSLEAEKLQLRVGILAVLALWYVQAEDARWLLEHERPKAKLAKEAFARVPRRPVIRLTPELEALVPQEEPTTIDDASAAVKERVREDLREHWQYLLAAEAAIADVSEEFGGLDPTLPRTCEWLHHAREGLEKVRMEAARYLGPIEDVELDDELVARTRRLVGLDG